MTQRSKVWLVVAAVFTLINVGGAVFAGLGGERLHCLAHVALAFVGAFVTWRIAVGRREAQYPEIVRGDPQLDALQQSVDAIAIEVERIGEAQRFATKLQVERPERPEKPL